MRRILLAEDYHTNAAYAILDANRNALAKLGIAQWTPHYPTRESIESDIKRAEGYVCLEGAAVAAYMQLSSVQDPEYAEIDWRINTNSVLTVHRLAVAPEAQGKGIAHAMMNFAEEHASKMGYAAIRLDAFSRNKIALKFYEKRGYYICGETHFAHRTEHFYCFEKPIVE